MRWRPQGDSARTNSSVTVSECAMRDRTISLHAQFLSELEIRCLQMHQIGHQP